ncbi:MAG: glycosyltransferase family 4 protein [Acidobacteria bacterium]|nr:glycosyltransferase family 4 protein [Acidobacteriota bacterium]MBU4307607.1 glycosyltransferase family 4 protein [Acidobacteriota bacterium]MBU4405933.1 glycosyltransferase family 4 protein [Acidobacteriota bacterium]MCG2811889.1 glycosyltransferase family 4 protein [Candidatus Aminicenantes bacterium]
MTVEQFLPALHYGDAIGNSALALHRFLHGRGIESRLVAITCDESLHDQTVLFNDYCLDAKSVKIMHFAVASQLTDFFLGLKGKKVMIYHNITPANFFFDFSEFLTRFTSAGREHLQRLHDCFDLSLGDSTYNANELRELGFANVQVFPLLVNLDDYGGEYSRSYLHLLKNERKNIVFTGRIMPNKKIEDLIKVVFFYKKYISPAVRLIVVGNTKTLPKYYLAVQDLAARFYLTAEDVFFTGHLPADEFLAVYRMADVFLSMSEHEGFCLPLLESCYFRLPVVAFEAGAVAETLDGAGILFNDKNSALVAGLVEQTLENKPLRRQLQARAGARIESYRRQADPETLLTMLRQL